MGGMMVKAWTCYLMQSTPRYQAWRAILGTDEVPIINPIPIAATLGDEEGIEVHKLDIDKLNLAQQSLLIDFCLRKFGSNITGDQRAQVERELNEVGVPISPEEMAVVFDSRHFVRVTDAPTICSPQRIPLLARFEASATATEVARSDAFREFARPCLGQYKISRHQHPVTGGFP